MPKLKKKRVEGKNYILKLQPRNNKYVIKKKYIYI